MDDSIRSILAQTPVIPVITIDHPDQAVPLAKALVAGGIPVLEVTLRTPYGLAAISAIKAAVPEAIVGAGTVTTVHDVHAVEAQQADFIVSPGLTSTFMQAAKGTGIPLLPGISTISELMLGTEFGLDTFKFFPAEAAGGVKVLKAFSGPFADICFCPTGGIGLNNMADYLQLKSVLSVGGSWVCPADLVAAQDWAGITRLSAEAVSKAMQIKAAA